MPHFDYLISVLPRGIALSDEDPPPQAPFICPRLHLPLSIFPSPVIWPFLSTLCS